MNPNPWSSPYRHGIGSGWKLPVGKLLTNRKIVEYQKLGKYGPELQLAIASSAERCVACPSKVAVRLMHYDYLPKPGRYCPRCRAHFRHLRDESVKQKQTIRKGLESFYV